MPHGLVILSQMVGLVIQCSTLITVIYAFVRFTQKPTVDLDTRVNALERWREKIDSEQLSTRTKQLEKDDAQIKDRLDDGTLHFKANDESNRVTQNALFAIMDAMGQMDNVPPSARQEIQQRKKDLMDYLTDR